MKKAYAALSAKFSTIRTILPLLVLAIEIITFIDQKLRDHEAKTNHDEAAPLGI